MKLLRIFIIVFLVCAFFGMGVSNFHNQKTHAQDVVISVQTPTISFNKVAYKEINTHEQVEKPTPTMQDNTQTPIPVPPTPTTTTPTPVYKDCPENGNGVICFGDYYKELPSSSYDDFKIVPKYIILHWDGRPAGNPKDWLTPSTWNGLAGGPGGGYSAHFAVGLDGVGQFLRMYDTTVIQGRAASYEYDPISINIEMAGRDYNDLVAGVADEETQETIKIISAKTLDLVVKLMKQYNIPFENVLGHYQIKEKRDPGDRWLQEYFLPLLKERLTERIGE